MLLTPIAIKYSFIHFGESLTTISLISLLENCVHLSVFEVTTKSVSKSGFSLTSGIVTLRSKIAPISRATLNNDNKSGLLAKTLRFNTSSSSPK